MAHGIDGNGLLLCLRQSFLARLTPHLNLRKLKTIEPYLFTIDHKLNVARYSAGLVQAMRPEDYARHYSALTARKRKPARWHTIAEYPKRCVYYAYDWDQYALGLLFFVETFAAAAFSLYDTCGALLKEIYNLPLNLDRVSFFNAIIELEPLAPNMYNFLSQYRLSAPVCFSWFKLLKELRNHTTHLEITDVVMLNAPTPPHLPQILLRREPIGSPTDLVLNAFIGECFVGIEEFVSQLYDRLAQQVEAEGDLPLTGKFDNMLPAP